MNYTQFLLGKLAEEASEIAQIALKAQQFGLESGHPDKDINNREEIYKELNDLNAIVGMLNVDGLNYSPNQENISLKKCKVLHFLEYSRKVGMVDKDE